MAVLMAAFSPLIPRAYTGVTQDVRAIADIAHARGASR